MTEERRCSHKGLQTESWLCSSCSLRLADPRRMVEREPERTMMTWSILSSKESRQRGSLAASLRDLRQTEAGGRFVIIDFFFDFAQQSDSLAASLGDLRQAPAGGFFFMIDFFLALYRRGTLSLPDWVIYGRPQWGALVCVCLFFRGSQSSVEKKHKCTVSLEQKKQHSVEYRLLVYVH